MYLHQARLTEAIKKLYMLGNKPYRGGKSTVQTGQDVGEVLGSMAPPVQRPHDNTMANAIQMQTAIRDAQLADKQSRAQWADLNKNGPVGPGYDMDNEYQKAMQRQKASDQAIQAPINGTFTRSGFDQHASQTQKKADDLNTSKQLMGLGGSLRMYRSPEEM